MCHFQTVNRSLVTSRWLPQLLEYMVWAPWAQISRIYTALAVLGQPPTAVPMVGISAHLRVLVTRSPPPRYVIPAGCEGCLKRSLSTVALVRPNPIESGSASLISPKVKRPRPLLLEAHVIRRLASVGIAPSAGGASGSSPEGNPPRSRTTKNNGGRAVSSSATRLWTGPASLTQCEN